MEQQNKISSNPRVSRSFFTNCHRIVQDSFGGFEAQVKFWWFPICWFQMNENGYKTNTWTSLEDAQNFILNGSPPKVKHKRKVLWKQENCG